MFDTLIFDLGKVVIDFDPVRALRKLNGKSPYSPEEFLTVLQEGDVMNRFETGRLDTRQFYLEVCNRLQLTMGLEEFTTVWSDIFYEELLLDEPFLMRFKPRYRLLALSNTNEMHMRYLKSHFSVLRCFDDMILSFEAGAMKPDEAIFRAALEKAQTSPERIFFIDDLAGNVEVATRLGWTAVQFTGREQLEADLAHHSILDV